MDGVQPRPCGEYTYGGVSMALTEGSTPPVRGIFRCGRRGNQDGRFNPARAGNINLQHLNCIRYQVQPRPCGEYHIILTLLMVLAGSTPPVRGISVKPSTANNSGRFNPARAGNIALIIHQQKCT